METGTEFSAAGAFLNLECQGAGRGPGGVGSSPGGALGPARRETRRTRGRNTRFNEASGQGSSSPAELGPAGEWPTAPFRHFRRPNFFPKPENVSEAWLAVLSTVSWVDLATWSMAFCPASVA